MRAILMAAAITGCTGSPNYWVPYTPIQASSAQPKNTAVQKAVIAVTDAGREIETSDATTGIVLTKWFSGDGFGGGETRFRIRVTFDEAAKYEIVSLCQRKSAATSAWSDGCDDETKRPRFVVDTMTRVDAALR